jgi:hypothetical protein
MDELARVPAGAVIEVASGGNNWRVAGRIVQTGKKQLTLRTDEELPVSASVKVQGTDDLIYLGEVLNSLQREHSSWDIQVAVKRRLMVL